MRMFVPFVVFCLSAVAATPASLVEVRQPAKIASTFSPRSSARLLNVWATWCVPCVEEMGDLRAIDAAFGRELSIVGISLDDMIPGDRPSTKRKVAGFLEDRAIRYTNVYYTGNSDALADSLRFNGEIPITVLFDRSGREVWRQQGRLDRQKAIAEIQKLLRRSR